MDYYSDFDPKSMNWYIKKDNDIQGPIKWNDVSFMIRAREISIRDYIKSESDQDWIQISDFPDFKKTFTERGGNESGDIMPDGTDAVYYLGMLAFFIGIVAILFTVVVGVVFLLISLLFEIGAIIFSFKNYTDDLGKTVGNILAIFWTCFQFIATIIIMIIKFS